MQRKPPPVLPDWLYVVVVGALSAYFLIGAVAWAIIAYEGRNVPDSFSTILATIAGGLVGILTPAREPRGPADRPGGGEAPSP